MSIPATVIHNGVISSAASPGGLSSRLGEQFTTSFCTTCGASGSGRQQVIGATDMSPFTIPLQGVAKVRVLAIKVRGGTGKLLLTSPVGTIQAIPLGSDSMIVQFSPAPGSEFTAVAFVGTADLEYLVAGDPS